MHVQIVVQVVLVLLAQGVKKATMLVFVFLIFIYLLIYFYFNFFVLFLFFVYMASIPDFLWSKVL